MAKGWYERKDPALGKARRHSEAAKKSKFKNTMRSPGGEISPFDIEADDFLVKHGITLKVSRSKRNACPIWCDGKHIHGDKYVVSLHRKDTGKLLAFPFWNSYQDKKEGHKPSAYDVLATMQKDDPGSFEEFADDFGYQKYEDTYTGRRIINRKSEKTYDAVVREWENIRDFFTEKELEELRGIW